MIKPFHHCKIWGTKNLKRKPSFGKFGSDFQSQPFIVVFSNKYSQKFWNTRALFNKVAGLLAHKHLH